MNRSHLLSRVIRFLPLHLCLGLFLSSAGVRAADPFAEIVRKTDPLPPEQEIGSFHLPPGFTIQLVASEPQIAKPINMAFDERGRLWITESREYPFPAPKERKARDAIKILDQFDANGRAQKITTFADDLNIPIGLYPLPGGAIGLSLPNVYRFVDADGDGVAEKRQVLYGPIGFDRDTHGLTSAFRRGFDGWLYACHGFNNNTTLRGRDGSSITMNSGNTYRMRIDGSRVEQFTWGQVNPFGLTFDALGNLYSADCHTLPIYQLLRGAYYPSFGKPHDGLGFGPSMMNHFHGSTAIGGIVHYDDIRFPTEFQRNFFVGNVMTCRINRDSVAEHGSTPAATEEPDFLRSDDPWFRPVDLQLGPDGAIYVADFYNRIIGHYEVPLDHPGRDRERGRIWRITYAGGAAGPPVAAFPASFDVSKSNVAGLLDAMGHPNITRRMLAMNQLVDRLGKTAVPELRKRLEKTTNAFEKIHGLWALQRLDTVTDAELKRAAADPDRGVRTHTMRILAESYLDEGLLPPPARELAFNALKDSDGMVARAAADALGQHPAFENIRPLLDLLPRIPKSDTHLLYVVRWALRNQLAVHGAFSFIAPNATETDRLAIADVALAVPTDEAASFLLGHIGQSKDARLADFLRHVARYGSEKEMDGLADFARGKVGNDLDLQLSLFNSIQDGTRQKGAEPGEKIQTWALELARALLQSADQGAADWRNHPIEGASDVRNPWFLQKRASSDGDEQSSFLCSLPPGGEHLTGRLRSAPFDPPARLKFFVAGHDGYPDRPAQHKNFVRIQAADNGEVFSEVAPPRNDLAQPVSVDLGRFQGRKAVVEIVDGDTGDAYAWLAVGRFDPPVVALPQSSPSRTSERERSAAEMAGTFKLAALRPDLERVARNEDAELDSRAASARALSALRPKKDEELDALLFLVGDPSAPSAIRTRLLDAVLATGENASDDTLLFAMQNSPRRLQLRVAQNLAGNKAGGEKLLQFAEENKVPATVLLDRTVKQKLLAADADRLGPRWEKLTRGLPSIDEQRQKLVDGRRTKFPSGKTDTAMGAAVFARNCVVCHQIGGQGGLVGPQLDGVGNRGLERLVEDILDPNRNVDAAFRYSTLVLNDDSILNGLQRREEGEVLVFADATGKEIKVQKKEVKERRESTNSLMPDNFGEMILEKDFNDLVAYLLSVRKP